MNAKWLLVALVLGACAQDGSQEDTPAADTVMPMSAMPHMVPGGDSAWSIMQRHMDSVRVMSAAQMHQNLASHHALVDGMLSGMSRQMQGFALADSIRSDLQHMRESMTPAQWDSLRVGHYQRMQRFMDMHMGMMR